MKNTVAEAFDMVVLDPGKGWLNATPHANLFERDNFRQGVSLLGELGYTYDSWHYHFQNEAFADLAEQCLELLLSLIILVHLAE